jgi:branched-chain amino acid transport system substrate-binding protein
MVAVGLAAGLLAGCTGGANIPGISGFGAKPEPLAETPAAVPGGIRVALILPLTAAGNVGAAGASLKNAADMAVAEFNNPKFQLLLKDDAGTPAGARTAAQQALAEGADIIIGPLLAPSVQAVGQVARPAGKPVIAFSTDASVAGPGVFLLSFLPETEVIRVVDFASARGKKSIAAMIPNTAYGNVVAAAFQETAAQRGVRVAAMERYNTNDKAALEAAAQRIAALGNQTDALFLPENGEGMAAAGAALATAGIDSRRLQLLGTSAWDDPRVLAVKSIQGGWFAAPAKAGFNSFAARYRSRFGSEPTRSASLAYDAVFLVQALFAKLGPTGLTDETLTNADGVIGTDGLFRFRPDGTNQRGIAVLQVGSGSTTVVSEAPRAFAPGT